MSSISQMERSSSQIRMLGMGALPDQPLRQRFRTERLAGIGDLRNRGDRDCLRGLAQSKHKSAALPQLRPYPNLAFVRLHNLIHDREAQTGSTLELRLKRLKN